MSLFFLGLNMYYRNINNGKYVNSTFKVPSLNSTETSTATFAAQSDSIKEALTSKGWTEDKFDSIS